MVDPLGYDSTPLEVAPTMGAALVAWTFSSPLSTTSYCPRLSLPSLAYVPTPSIPLSRHWRYEVLSETARFSTLTLQGQQVPTWDWVYTVLVRRPIHPSADALRSAREPRWHAGRARLGCSAFHLRGTIEFQGPPIPQSWCRLELEMDRVWYCGKKIARWQLVEQIATTRDPIPTCQSRLWL